MTELEGYPVRVLVVAAPSKRASSLPDVLRGRVGFTIAVREPEGVLAECGRQMPDVILVDIFSPMESGLQLIRQVMAQVAVPVVAIGEDGPTPDFEGAAIAAGALLAVPRPVPPDDPHHEQQMTALEEAVRLMAEVRVVRRRPRGVPPVREPRMRISRAGAPRILAMGASTGGPAVLQTIFKALPEDFPLPIVIVQHIAAGFLPGMIDWLQTITRLRLEIGRHEAAVLPGHAYFAPDGQQMGVNGGRLVLGPPAEHDGHCPSISCLFRSVADSFGADAVAILLTGMGRDGARELLRLRRLGAITIAQDRESCVVFGMPGRAVELDAATLLLSPSEIIDELLRLARLVAASH